MSELIINGRFLEQPVTGVQRYAREFVVTLDKMLQDYPLINVSLLSSHACLDVPVLKNIKHRIVGKAKGQFWEQFELPLYTQKATLFCLGNIAPLWNLFFRKERVVVTVHDLSYRYFPEAYNWKFRWLYGFIMPVIMKRAKAVITVSQAEKNSILNIYPEVGARLHAVQNGGLPENLQSQASNHISAKNTVLYVGSLSKRKNFDGMLSTARYMLQYRDMKFIFVGGTASALKESVSDLPLEMRQKIQFVGQVNDPKKLVEYYSNASCFFFPSFYEASPLPPIEAMACGCPVVSSTIPSLIERCGDAALYCDPHDVKSMAGAISRMLDEQGVAESFRKLGYLRAAEYSWRQCVASTMEIVFDDHKKSEKTGTI